MIRATILGCGSSGGVPRIGNRWGACDPANPKNRRRRCSLLVERPGPGGVTRVLIDTGPDLVPQLLDANVATLDAVVYTHAHADHIHGIDDLRQLAQNAGARIPAWADGPTSESLLDRFGYIFETPAGSFYPPVCDLRLIDGAMMANGPGGPVTLIPFRVRHGEITALGLRIGGLVYLPDVSDIPPAAWPLIHGADVFICDALRPQPHPSHAHMAQALDWIERSGVPRGVLTNMHIDMDYATVAAGTPAHVQPAFDGMAIETGSDAPDHPRIVSVLFNIIVPVFLIVGFGYAVAWRGIFRESAVDGLMVFAQNFAAPTLLFASMSRLDLGAEFRPALLLPFYIGAFSSYAIGWAGARFVFDRPPMDCVAIGFTCLFSNSLLLGIPIMERAYGPESLAGNWAIIAIHSPLLYTFGITVMEFTRARGSGLSVGRVAVRAMTGVLRTPLVIGILTGVSMNVLIHAGLVMPEGFWAAVDMIAGAALPAALFGLGGVLYRYRPEGDTGAIALCCACSLLIHPGLAYGIGRITGLDDAGLRSAVMTAAMAPGVNAYLFANLYGAARRVAATTVLVGTAVSVLSIWMWLAILP